MSFSWLISRGVFHLKTLLRIFAKIFLDLITLLVNFHGVNELQNPMFHLVFHKTVKKLSKSVSGADSGGRNRLLFPEMMFIIA